MMIKISIVIPVYNVEKYLSSCIESIIAQNFDSYEIICVNDGSTDSSGKILDKYAKKYHFIKVIHKQNEGQAKARNIGMDNSSGKYLLFLDSDDRIENGTLAELYENAEKNKTDIVYFDAQCIFENEDLYDAEKERYYIRNKCYGINTGKELFSRFIQDNCFTDSACLMLYRKDFLVENNIKFIEGIIYEDCHFSVLCFMRANVVQHINKRYYLYTVHNNSTMTTSMFKYINLYSRLMCFKEFSDFYFTENLTNQQKYSLLMFINVIKCNINYIYSNLDDNEMEKLLDNVNLYDYLYELSACNIDIAKAVSLCRIKELTEKKRENQSITIYGAGIRAKRLYGYLKIYNSSNNIKNFLVSDRNENPQSLFKLPVCSLSENYVPDKNDLVVIAVQAKFVDQIKENLEKHGILNYLVVDDGMNAIMIERIKKSLCF